MPRELSDLGRTVRLRPARRRGLLLPLVAVAVVVAAVAARASDDQDPTLDQLVTGPPPAAAAEAPAPEQDQQQGADAVEEPPAVDLPVMGRAGGLLLHVPAERPLVVSYHEASFPQALPIQPLGRLSANENGTRTLEHETHPDGIEFHVQVSRGRVNASTSAVDVVLPPGEEVRAPVAGTVVDVRPYQLYGRHDDFRIELRPDDSDLAVVMIHVQDLVVRTGDRVAVGDALAGSARKFPFGAVVDRQTEPERYGHVHLEVKTPDDVGAPDGTGGAG